ncbi:hypothetical protein DESPIG_02871 [Desulfovibrio piger ATCC 29098]|uniref:Uncharacterized protein n=1 Tax=Desulfovibrio piger ATCC 29098 TaxID=411464 RepID=B6WXP4_9BACT|nr:hypothetical protein DESPIG_02871 [Desulfovibrio piger ATCC 29098]
MNNYDLYRIVENPEEQATVRLDIINHLIGKSLFLYEQKSPAKAGQYSISPL